MSWTQSLLLIFLWCLLLNIEQGRGQNNVCLWGHQGPTQRAMNGLYRVGGEINGRPFFKLDRDVEAECSQTRDNSGNVTPIGISYYLWWSRSPFDTWYLSFGTNGQFFFDLNGIAQNTISRCPGSAARPEECTSWQTRNPRNGQYEVMSSIKVIPNGCPSFDCRAITVTGKTGTFDITSSNGCTSMLNGNENPLQQRGTNLFSANRQGSTPVFWRFNAALFRWECSDRKELPEDCRYSIRSWNNQEFGWKGWSKFTTAFTGLSDGQTAVIEMDSGAKGCTIQPCTYTFTCVGKGSTTSLAPTTPRPSFAEGPVVVPTFRPVTPEWFRPPSTQPPSAPGNNGNIGNGNGNGNPNDNGNNNNNNNNQGDGQQNSGGGGGYNFFTDCTWLGLLCWIWIIIGIGGCLLLVGLGLLIYKLVKRRQQNQGKHVEMFGDQESGYEPNKQAATYTND